MAKTSKITVNDKQITILQADDRQNYISLTDMIKAYEPDPIRTDMIIGNWLRLKDTIEYMGIWETLNNPSFNPIEFDGIKTSAGSNRFILTAKEWVTRTGAIDIQARAGRYGGTYAHKDIAYNFGIFGCTAKDWQEANPELAGKYNMRDTATIKQLVVLSNMESANSEMLKQGIGRQERYQILHKMAIEQLTLFDRSNTEHKFRKLLPRSK